MKKARYRVKRGNPKLIGVRNVGHDRYILAHCIPEGGVVGLDDSEKQIVGKESGLVAPESELRRWLADWPNEFMAEYEEQESENGTDASE